MMDGHAEESYTKQSTAKKRIPKACNSCRQSKVRCDEERPSCSRCRNLLKTCVYVERPKSASEERIEQLEKDLVDLRQQLAEARSQQYVSSAPWHQASGGDVPLASPQSTHSQAHSHRSLKRKRSQFELQNSNIPDFVTTNTVSTEEAITHFQAFFDGCDRFVPVFDPRHDTFESVKKRDGLLFNAICTVGCGVFGNADLCRTLTYQLRKWLNLVILNPQLHSLETVQALLVMACWMSERSLILSVAMRMAMDLNLADDFDLLVGMTIADRTTASAADASLLMRRARTWFCLMVHEHILRIDAGDLPGFNVKGGVRRCRILLNRPYSTKLDMRLFSQVELNHLRDKINNSVASCAGKDDEELLETVQDVRVDLDIWFTDWKRIIETSPHSNSEDPVLLLNLSVQKYWAESIALCRAVRATGIDNVATMSPGQSHILVMAREALQKHLDIILADPAHYLANFKYAMDFVWAKCAFCFLLLLKLTRLLPMDDSNAQWRLLEDGERLLAELTAVCSPILSNSSKLYLRVLSMTLEKYARTLQADSSGIRLSTVGQSVDEQQSSELDSFIPEEFVMEWDFPGLTLFSSSSGWDALFDQFFLGFNGNDSLLLGVDV